MSESSLREAIARAIYEKKNGGMTHLFASWDVLVEEAPTSASHYFGLADAVLAVLADHDAKVRAEELRSALHDLGDWADEMWVGVGDEHDESTWDTVPLREWVEWRADRIERGEQA